MQKKYLLSIAISTYNLYKYKLEILERLLFPSLINNASKDYELVIIDDHSPLKDETKGIIKKWMLELKKNFGNVIYRRNKANLGFSRSYNRAISHCNGEFIIIANDDVYFPKASIRSLLENIKSNNNIGAIVPVGNNCTGYNNTLLFSRLKNLDKEEIQRIEDFASWVKKVSHNQMHESTESDSLTMFCVIIRKSLVKKIKGFDEQFKFGLYEDIDFLRKIRNLNKKVYVSLGTFIEHGGINGSSSSIMQHPYKVLKMFFVNIIKYHYKWESFDKIFSQALGLPRRYDLMLTATSEIKKLARKKGLMHELKEI